MAKQTWRSRGLPENAAAVIRTSPSLAAAAERLGVDKSTVSRWVKSGKAHARELRPRSKHARVKKSAAARSAAAWERFILGKYEVSAVERPLLSLARDMYELARDRNLRPEQRATCAGRFNALVKALKIPLEDADETANSKTENIRAFPRRA